MKFIFLVQGEGRGHLTQAIALQQLLRANNHKVVRVLVGKSPQREIPKFFMEKINAPITFFFSPNYIRDDLDKSINLSSSIILNLIKMKVFLSSIKTIQSIIDKEKPDIIINFYESLFGIYKFFDRLNIPSVSIGHQYMFLHPDFNFPSGYYIQKNLAKLFTQYTTFGVNKKFALSFYPLPALPHKDLVVLPPLIRQDIITYNSNESSDHYLVYLLNAGYGQDIIEWHSQNIETRMHCFWDHPNAREEWCYNENLIFHQINDRKFIDLMSKSKGVISTAGFESICEACYFGKTVCAVPVSKHYDQLINAHDLEENAKMGYSSTIFDIGFFIEKISKADFNYSGFKSWVREGQTRIIHELESIQ